MHTRRNTIVNISLILITCIVVIVCMVVHSTDNKSFTSTEETSNNSIHSESIALLETLQSETESTESESDAEYNLWYMANFSRYNINLSAPTLTAPPSFNSDEEIYNHATEQMNTRKYYTAIKYLQMIPNYKDSTQLQMKIYTLVNQRLFSTDSMPANISKDNIIQLLGAGYIDKNGTLHITATNINNYTYNNLYLPLLNLNKTTKFQSIVFNKEGMNSRSISGSLLTKSGDIISFYLDMNTDKLHFHTIDCSTLSSDERIVHITTEQAISNKGYVYNYYSYKLDKSNIADSATIIANSFLYVTANGTLVNEQPSNYVSFPALSQWSDIIYFSTDYDIFHSYPDYCVGLTSSGAVYLALPKDPVTKRILDTNCTYVALANAGNIIHAITDTGELHTYHIPNYPK